MTRGFKSSEFFIACMGMAMGGVLAIKGIGAGEIAAALSMGATYIAGRSFKKGMKGEENE